MYNVERNPAVAGYFYPSDEASLNREIERLFTSRLGPGSLPEVVLEGPRKIFGLISPHAGYTYSGPIAAHAYHHLAGDGLPEDIILIGPNHTGVGGAISLYPNGVWHLPLGDLVVDKDFTEKLSEAEPYIDLSVDAHVYEHSIEVQLPFLQYLYSKVGKTFRIIPIIMMQQTWSGVEILGNALTKVLSEMDRENYLIIASTDFSHYVTAETAGKKDRFAIDKITSLDPYGLIETVYTHDISMCGYGPVSTLLYVANNLGAKKSVLLKYANSGDVTGDYSSVVAYASFKILWSDEGGD